MPPEFNTLEDARAEILRLNEELTNTRSERDNYSTQITNLEKELGKVRDLNQEYFLKLRAQYQNPDETDPDEGGEQTPSCEDFAKTLTI